MDQRLRLFNSVKCASNILKKLIRKENQSFNNRKRPIKIKIFERNKFIEIKLEKNLNHSSLVIG
jgi:hypothetical protein